MSRSGASSVLSPSSFWAGPRSLRGSACIGRWSNSCRRCRAVPLVPPLAQIINPRKENGDAVIELSRKQVHTIRSTIRKAMGVASTRRALTVTFQATADGLLIRALNDHVAIECRVPGNFGPSSFAVPFEALVKCEGRHDDTVRFENSDDQVTLNWSDAGIPQSAQYQSAEPVSMPESPPELAVIDRPFLNAMADACNTTDNDSTRYALNCVRLRGADGQIAATDGRQALIQTGFEFPWADEILIPATDAFATKAVRESQSVAIGRTPDHLMVRADAWTMMIKIEKDRRFPAIDSQVPDVSAAATKLVLSEGDAEFLILATNRLPGAEDAHSPVTLDLNGAVVVRAKSNGQASSTDLVLRNSRRVGDEMKVSTDRGFLKRAVQLGFHEIHLRDADAPAFCRTDRRAYIWALLGKDAVLKPSPTAVRIESPVIGPPPVATHLSSSPAPALSRESTSASRNRISMMKSHSQESRSASSEGTRSDAKSLTELIEDGEALRTVLRDALNKTTTLVTGLKRQRHQSHLMRAALKSLRAVQAIES